jgi:glucose-1-phosphate thymidylyltransferase
MLSGIRDILVVSTPRDTPQFTELLGDGSKWGINLQYAVQQNPEGIAQAFLIAEKFLGGSPAALILGDNIFYGHGLTDLMSRAASKEKGATIFAYHVSDPERFGVVEFSDDRKVTSIEEKPRIPKSNYAVTGLYFYDRNVCDYASELRPSPRGELEITDLNDLYLQRDELFAEVLGRGYAWLDTGTHDSLLEAGAFVATLQKRQGLYVAAPEEVAFNNNWISHDELSVLAAGLSKTDYGAYLMSLVRGKFDAGYQN